MGVVLSWMRNCAGQIRNNHGTEPVACFHGVTSPDSRTCEIEADVLGVLIVNVLEWPRVYALVVAHTQSLVLLAVREARKVK